MRNAFISAEDVLLKKIESVIAPMRTKKISSQKVKTLHDEIIVALEKTKGDITSVKDKYQNLTSTQQSESIASVWTKLTTLQDQFTAETNAFHEGISHILNQIPPRQSGSSRQEVIHELIANISAARDNGRSQETLLRQIQADVIVSAAFSILQLPDETRNDNTVRRTCVTQVLNTEVQMLRQEGNEAVLAMWQNQMEAVSAFIENFLQLETQSHTLSVLQENVVTQWEAFSDATTCILDEQEQEDNRLNELVAIIDETRQALFTAQEKAKALKTDFGLTVLMDEIINSQEKFMEDLKKSQRKLRAGVKMVYQLAEESIPDECNEFESSSECTSSSSSSSSEDDSDSDSISEHEHASTQRQITQASSQPQQPRFFNEHSNKKRRIGDKEENTDEDDLILLNLGAQKQPSARM